MYSSSCVGGELVQVTHQLAWHLLTIPSLVDDLCVKELKGRLKIGAYIHCAQKTMVLHLRLSQAIWTLQCWTSSIPSLPHSLYVLSLFSSLATIPPSSQRLLCHSTMWLYPSCLFLSSLSKMCGVSVSHQSVLTPILLFLQDRSILWLCVLKWQFSSQESHRAVLEGIVCPSSDINNCTAMWPSREFQPSAASYTI